MNFKFLLTFVFLLNYFFSSLSVAENLQTKTKELTSLQKKIKLISQNINDLKVQKNSLLAELKKLDTQYGESAALLKNLETHVKQLKDALKKNRQRMDAKQQDIDSQKRGLENQIKAAYSMGKNEKLKLLLNQQDPALSGRVMVYYDYFNKLRIKKIARIDKSLQQLRELEAERIKESALLKEKLDKKKLERSILLKTKVDRKFLLAKINTQFFSKTKQLGRFKANEKSLKLLISSLQHAVDDFPLNEGSVKEFALLKGKLPWPVKGKLIKKFGAQRSDSRWDGVLIKSKEGTEIRAVTRGRIVYAEWLRGYGLLTIIDHGKGYMTLYAFNQSLYKTVGDWVDAGTVIAAVGQSGGQSDTGLYFGIRKKGKPVNPVSWCRKIRNGKVG